MESLEKNLIRLVDAKTMREMDRHAMEDLGIPGVVLMENAARSVADWVEENRLINDHGATVVVSVSYTHLRAHET